MRLKVSLKSNVIKAVHPVPSVKDLALSYLIALQRKDISKRVMNDIENFLTIARPTFFIPDYVVDGENLILSDTTYYIDYTTKITHYNLDAFSQIMGDLDCFMGVDASFEIVDEDVQFNTFQWKNGFDVDTLTGSQSYLYKEKLPRNRKTGITPTRIVMDLDVHLPEAQALSLTNLLHKYLVKSFPYNHQLKGSYMNTRLGDDDCLYYKWESTKEGTVSRLSIESVNGITNEVTLFLEHGNHGVTLSYEGQRQQINMTHYSTDFYSETPSSKYKTVKPVFLAGKVKKNTGLQFTPEANILSSIESTFNYSDYEKLHYFAEDGWVCSEIRGLGKVCVKASPIDSPVIGKRGSRSGTNNCGAYGAVIKFEKEVVLRAVGMHRRFGAGVTVPI